MPVICYNLAGTENAQSSKASGKDDTAVRPCQHPGQIQNNDTFQKTFCIIHY